MSSPFQVGQGAYGPPSKQDELIVARRFLAWGFIVFLALVLAGVNILLPSILNDIDDSPITGIMLGICIAEVNLIALWGVMAPGRWLLRLPWSFALLVIMWYTLAIGAQLENGISFQLEEALHLGETLVLGYLAAVFPLMIIAAIFGWKLERPEDQQVREQMSIGLLLGVMTLLAVLLAMGRYVLPPDGFRLSMMDTQIFILLGAIILFNLLQTTPAIWISFLPSGIALASAMGMIVYAILLSVLEILFISMFLGMPPDFWEIMVVFSAMNVGQVAVVMAVLAAMRLLGFQLLRRNGANPFGEVTPRPQLAAVNAAPLDSYTPSNVDQLFNMDGAPATTTVVASDTTPLGGHDAVTEQPAKEDAPQADSPFADGGQGPSQADVDAASVEARVNAALLAAGRSQSDLPSPTEAPQTPSRTTWAIGIFFIVGPILASVVRIPLLLQSAEISGALVGGLIGWIIGSIVSIVIGIVLVRRSTNQQ